MARDFSSSSSDPRQWGKIFNAMVQMLRSQQLKLEILSKERRVLLGRLRFQHVRSKSDVSSLEDQLSLMDAALKEAELGHNVQEAKFNLVVGMKKREAFYYRTKSECAEADMDDILQCFDLVTHKSSEQKEKQEENTGEVKGMQNDGDPKIAGINKEEKRSKVLEREIKKLNRNHENNVSRKNAEISALLAERDFVWNQFKKMESDYTNLLKSKNIEVELAKDNIQKLEVLMENLQSSVKEKDELITTLRADRDKIEMVMRKCTEETPRLLKELELLKSTRNASLTPVVKEKDELITTLRADRDKIEMDMRKSTEETSRLLKELELLKSSRNAWVTPVGNPKVKSGECKFKVESNRGSRSHNLKDSDRRNNTDMGLRRCSKRNRSENTYMSGSPMLFSSTFKVPKLRSSYAFTG
ncbi:hypothetical protein QJS04_geneDACA017336 [Acorus gramineus]|uniref:Uncharacterized protein n=1 Tax=Acorus gramineus TaxID=55184 RepID=A0AAV9BA83_ACOGR|nr:hypothetical protein QJS04_geneDACA017336 [Acorus gramineus]